MRFDLRGGEHELRRLPRQHQQRRAHCGDCGVVCVGLKRSVKRSVCARVRRWHQRLRR